MRHLGKSLWMKRFMGDSRGQGLVEYALILVLIAIIVIAAIKNLGITTNSVFSTINSGMGP